MKKINPEKAARRRNATNVNLTEKDWKHILDGGMFELQQGDDFDGTVSGADAIIREVLTARMGAWRISQDKKNGTITVTIQAPSA